MIDRRTTLRWMLAVSASLCLPRGHLLAASAAARAVDATGYGSDPDLTRIYKPGELWPLTLTAAQRHSAGALCDAIMPADRGTPSASAVGVVDFLDEWLSAPYPVQRRDRQLLLGGLAWMDEESVRRFAKPFAELGAAEQHAICDDICYQPRAKAELASAARFFARYRDLTAGAYYSTPIGRKDLRYVGNVPLAKFDGPPRDLLDRLGLTDTLE